MKMIIILAVMALNIGKTYKTSQREYVLNYLKDHKNDCLTVQEIFLGMQRLNMDIGKTTVYRCLDILVENGTVKKFIAETGDGASYQYTGENSECNHHFHLKCVRCGEILHLDCEFMSEMERHIYSSHHFSLDNGKSILYGICESCKVRQ